MKKFLGINFFLEYLEMGIKYITILVTINLQHIMRDKIKGSEYFQNSIERTNKDKYKPIRNFLDAHYIDNYGWIFTEPLRVGQGKIIKRNP